MPVDFLPWSSTPPVRTCCPVVSHPLVVNFSFADVLPQGHDLIKQRVIYLVEEGDREMAPPPDKEVEEGEQQFWEVLPFFPSFRWGCFPRCALQVGFFLFSGNQAPEGGRERPKKEEAKQHHPQGRGKAAPLKWRRRDHHSTGLKLQLTKLISTSF